RIEILGYDAHDPNELALPGLQDQAVLLQEVEQVLLRQFERTLAFRDLLLGRLGITVRRGRKGPPQVAIGLFLVFQPLADALTFSFRRQARWATIAENPLIHQRVGRIEYGFHGSRAVPFL